MKQVLICIALFVGVFTVYPGCSLLDRPGQDRTTVENVRAFARLYGYVRYFHPSDEASTIDWETFALYGVSQVKHVADRNELRLKLEELFLPIAPTLQFFLSGDPAPAPSALLFPQDTTGHRVVAWQHQGVGLGTVNSMFTSIRINRENILSGGGVSGTATQSLDASPYRGKVIKLTAAVKADVEYSFSQVQLRLHVRRAANARGFFDSMSERPIVSQKWGTYETVGEVADDATTISLGASFYGNGTASFDDFQLFVKEDGDTWAPVPLQNPGFEDGEPGDIPANWSVRSFGAVCANTAEDSFSGEQSLTISGTAEPLILTEPLFDRYPQVGEVVNKTLGRGLSVQIPLALYSYEGQTLGRDARYPLAGLDSALAAFDIHTLDTEDEDLHLGGIVIAWNVFQHFYPYFDVVDTDWENVLSGTISDALTSWTTVDYYNTLRRMIAQLHDGHGDVYLPEAPQKARPPFLVDWIEDQVVVVATVDSVKFKPGDIVESIDGIPATELLAEEEALISGSPQRKRFRALSQFGSGPVDSEVHVSVVRNGEQMEIFVTRSQVGELYEERPADIEEIEKGIFYVNLDLIQMASFVERVDELARAEGVIFDLRGFPNLNSGVLAYLTDTPLQWTQQLIPQFIYPDRENIVGYDTLGQRLMPAQQPGFEGKVTFLINGQASNSAESMIGIVEHYKLGEIVGQSTAGSIGYLNPFRLPGGIQIIWTGTHVVKHDQSQLHSIGIQPTVRINRTIEGVRAGRDEYIEKALAIIRR